MDPPGVEDVRRQLALGPVDLDPEAGRGGAQVDGGDLAGDGEVEVEPDPHLVTGCRADVEDRVAIAVVAVVWVALIGDPLVGVVGQRRVRTELERLEAGLRGRGRGLRGRLWRR